MNYTSSVIYTDSTSEETVSNFVFPEKAVAKRKSSIFTRRSSVAFLDKEDPCGCPSDDATDKNKMELEAYVEILKNEIDGWKIMYKQRRDTRKKATTKIRTKSLVNEDVLGILTEEDNKFLADRPAYHRTGRDAMSALERLQISIEGTKNVEKSIFHLVEHVQLAESVMKRRIIEDSFK